MALGSPASASEIPLRKSGGVYTVPVRINDVLTLNFILDTGASEVQIPADVALTLLRTGTIADGDFLPGRTYRMADGSQVKSARFVLRSLQIGELRIDRVTATLGAVEGPLLLGQSLLSRLPSWSLDNRRRVLVLAGSNPLPPRASPPRHHSPPQQAAAPVRPGSGHGVEAKKATGWMAVWRNDIRAIGKLSACTVGEFAGQGYKYAFSVDVPVATLKKPADAWTKANGRATTVLGCWLRKANGLVHAKLRRKRDGKTWEQDFNFNDGSWKTFR